MGGDSDWPARALPTIKGATLYALTIAASFVTVFQFRAVPSFGSFSPITCQAWSGIALSTRTTIRS